RTPQGDVRPPLESDGGRRRSEAGDDGPEPRWRRGRARRALNRLPLQAVWQLPVAVRDRRAEPARARLRAAARRAPTQLVETRMDELAERCPPGAADALAVAGGGGFDLGGR